MGGIKSFYLRQTPNARFFLICVCSGVMLIALTMLVGLALSLYGMMLK